MATTDIVSRQIRDGEVKRVDLNTATSGSAVITKVIAGAGITLSSTGADAGTGDVTVNTTALTKAVNQTAHGLSVGNAVKSNGSTNQYAKAQADSAANAEVIGIVTTVTDADNFVLTTSGEVTAGVPALSAGTVLFLDPSTAGALTSTEPTTNGQVSKPLAVIVHASTRMFFMNMRGLLIDSTTDISSGTYTPTLTNVANLDGSTAYDAQYMKVGSTVTVSGKVDVNPTLTVTSTQLGISLPIASALSAAEQCGGTAFAPGIAGQGAAILADATNDRAQMQWVASDVSNQSMYFTFTYKII